MANIPKQFTQEAQDERDMQEKLTNPKSRWSWKIGEGMTQAEWDEIFGRNDTESK